jgi:hypothetical protein
LNNNLRLCISPAASIYSLVVVVVDVFVAVEDVMMLLSMIFTLSKDGKKHLLPMG